MAKALGARGEITRRKITDRQRRARALALRKSGQGYAQIAETLICVECGHNPHSERGCGSDYCECSSSLNGWTPSSRPHGCGHSRGTRRRTGTSCARWSAGRSTWASTTSRVASATSRLAIADPPGGTTDGALGGGPDMIGTVSRVWNAYAKRLSAASGVQLTPPPRGN